MPSDLWAELERAPWEVAFRIHGNSHYALIGLMVRRWIDGDRRSRWVLGSAPTYATSVPGNKGKGNLKCDAI